MPGINTTLDARASLREVIDKRYGRKISGDEWSTVSPAGAPMGGLGSSDATDWLITLDRASDKMVEKGYMMSAISRDEAGAKRTAKLDVSVAFLAGKAKAGAPARALVPLSMDAQAPLSTRQVISLTLGLAALTGAIIVVAAGIRKFVRSDGREK